MKVWMQTNKYEIYLVGLSLCTYLSFIGWLDVVIMPLFISIAIAIILLRQDIFYLISLGIFIAMSFSGMRDNVQATTLYTILFTVLIVFDVFYNRTISKVGKLFDPLLVIALVSVITLFNAPSAFIWFAGIINILIVLLLYIYFVNTTNNPEEDYMLKASKMFLYGAVVVTFEMIYFLTTNGEDPLTLITRRQINVGWENINIIIYINIMAIPLLANILLKAKYKAYYMVLGLLAAVGIILTLSRSSVLTLGVFGLYVIIYVILKTDKKVNLLYHSLIVVGIIIIGVVLLEQTSLVSGTLEAFFGREFLAYDSRAELIEEAFYQFKQHFIIGSGGLYSSRYYLEHFGAKNYHNTIAQASTLGILGLSAFVWLFVVKVKMLLEKKNSWTITMFVLLFVTAFINGWVQPMYFYASYMIYLFLLLAIYENIQKT